MTLTGFILDYAGAFAAGSIVLLGLLIGLRDLLRFSPRRISAIASVCFRQSIRRRVLWLTPVVIAGVLVVSQFQKAIDAQDATRQITMYCLFAAGLLVTLVVIILACTNLPHEIDTRVIFTVATKPVTRLEIILGKIVGFACVSFWILLIMGVFTLGYLHLRDWRARSTIAAQLAAGAIDPNIRSTAEYYRDAGTLHAREMAVPFRLSILTHRPERPDDFWSPGGGDGEIHIPFRVDRSLVPMPDLQSAPDQLGPTLQPTATGRAGGAILALDILARPSSLTAPTTRPTEASVTLNLMNGRHETMVSSADLRFAAQWTGGTRHVELYIPPELFDKWLPPSVQMADVFISVVGGNHAFEYSVDARRMHLKVPGTQTIADLPTAEPIYTGRMGYQLRGRFSRPAPVAFFEFHNPNLKMDRGRCSFELRTNLERDGRDTDANEDAAIHVRLEVRNHKTGAITRGIEISPENNRPIYFDVPAAAAEGGDFDVVARLTTSGWINLRGGQMSSLKLVLGNQSFAWNLLKSLAILWLMSLLVIIISVFSSTFVSWPIAVVLTLVIITGHWGADQMGDIAQPGIGRQIVNDMFRGSSAATSRAVSESVDALVRMLNIVSAVLPDISQFAAIQDIERGAAISPSILSASLLVLLLFGLPLTVLAYIFLKFKEVAP